MPWPPALWISLAPEEAMCRAKCGLRQGDRGHQGPGGLPQPNQDGADHVPRAGQPGPTAFRYALPERGRQEGGRPARPHPLPARAKAKQPGRKAKAGPAPAGPTPSETVPGTAEQPIGNGGEIQKPQQPAEDPFAQPAKPATRPPLEKKKADDPFGCLPKPGQRLAVPERVVGAMNGMYETFPLSRKSIC